MASSNNAKFSIGEVVKHRHFDFRGVIYDVDFEFNNSEEWYQSIPKDVRPRKDQPFYHLLAESNDVTYEAYVSEQNLLLDQSKKPVRHPLIDEIFSDKYITSDEKCVQFLILHYDFSRTVRPDLITKMVEQISKGNDPDYVTEEVLALLDKKKWKPRYLVGKDVKPMKVMLGIMSESLFEKTIQKAVGIPQYKG